MTQQVCIMAPTYFPAHRSGGPVPGIRGVVDTLGGQDVRMVTADRDLGDVHPFPPPHRGTTTVDGILVTYLGSPRPRNLRDWGRAYATMRTSDVVYLNSLMSKMFTVVPVLLLALLGYRGRVAMSPRGELAGSALRLGGSRQKRAWIRLMTTLRLDQRIGSGRRGNVVWLASSEHEARDVLAAFPSARVVVSPERLRSSPAAAVEPRAPLEQGLRLVSVGRIAPVKGTVDLVAALVEVTFPVSLDLVGHVEDAAYAAKIHELLERLPPYVQVVLRGGVPPDQVSELLDRAHLSVLLTHGENFGHAIGESLQRGTPVLISDQTPWSVVAERGAGLVIETDACRDPRAVAAALASVAHLTQAEWQAMSDRAGDIGRAGLVSDEGYSLLEAVALLNH